MKNHSYNREDMICALATPLAESALAVIRCSGPGIIEKCAALFRPGKSLAQAAGNTLVYGKIVHPETGQVLDEVLASVFRSPRSYTGQDSVEFSCHGSLPGLQAILTLFREQGIRQASPGEFTFRAFLNGKMDLTRAEAVQEIVSAKSAASQSLAMNRLSGAIEKEINRIKDDLLILVAAVSLALDYPEDEVDSDVVIDTEKLDRAQGHIRRLLATYGTGQMYREGVRLVLTGQTNAGKSSLFNLILREERSIVSEVHGTTRDYLESWISLGGIPVRLYDTAGLREADNPVEREGIRRAGEIVEQAHIILYLVDGVKGLTEEDRIFLEERKDHACLIPLWNKADLTDKAPPLGFLPISASTAEGFDRLEKAVTDRLMDGKMPAEGAVIDSLRQKELLEEADTCLNRFKEGMGQDLPMDILSEDLRNALDALGEITGEVGTEDILETMFSRFCVGK
ncbi:MAG: tRNA uridine-5-carboxymethylaminomethyl(34) synthesis GTPase MnmE [Spirochaetales bacterium]|nr:tRNA uridine-5-carboxymethylaminomethyl(34) synthesis GTPase MnmE [Spirochaetales bacterium]